MRQVLLWLLLVAVVLLLCAAELRRSITPLAPDQSIRAGVPFVEQDPAGATLVCISNQDGRPLPPYEVVVLPTSAPTAGNGSVMTTSQRTVYSP